MSDSVIYLVGIDPPGNLCAQLIELDRVLFREFGVVSGTSLDPVIPVCTLPDRPDSPDPQGLSRFPTLSTRAWRVIDDTLFLSLEPEAPLRQSIENIRTLLRQPDEHVLPAYPGIYLTRLDDPKPAESWPEDRGELMKSVEQQREALLSAIGPPPQLRWSGGELSCRKIAFTETNRWWAGASIEVCWRLRLRAERRGE